MDEPFDRALLAGFGEQARLHHALDPDTQRVGLATEDVAADEPRDVVVVQRVATLDRLVGRRAEALRVRRQGL